ncbi:MAG: hypothetical protein M3Y87_17250, partial [Myxococcota bacterium]|nr:hypothetical protein [Myxococcota bacterium]
CQAGACVCGSGAGARACVAPAMGAPGESCCDGTCIANTTESCVCEACTGDDTCQAGTSLLMPGAVQVCCGGDVVAFLGCGGFGSGDGGFPFPFP